MNHPTALTILYDDVIACRLCPRLVEYRERIGREKRRAYLGCTYWARPVPGFGDPAARVLAFGLAPGAHGSNRTGRPFTGDASGKFMYPILHRLGFASQPNATSPDDGLQLRDLWISAAVRCAPPDNKPLPSELANCAAFTRRELDALPNLQVVVALGKFAFDAYLGLAPAAGSAALPAPSRLRKSSYPFAHAAEYRLPSGITLLASYHPSNQNTATGKLTASMFEAVFARALQLARD
ncbi:MAG: uracil-DNA glycosylase [Candidatus Korobacteraceae bacterium]